MNQNTPATLLNDIFRSVFTFIDRPCFWLLGLMYKIFFNVASADIFSSGTILSFYKRVQLIIGVFMLFQLTITIVKGIINPEEMTDGKSGKNNVIYRVMVSLFMLVAIMPINIPNAKSEYQIQLNNNGLLFGTLFSLQNRILSNNTIGRLVLGTTSVSSTSTSSTTTTSSNSTEENLEKSANIFTTTVLKGFIRINLKDGKLKDPGEGKEPEVLNENRMCTDIDDETLKIYTKLDSDPGDILDLVNASCTSAKSASWFGEAAINKALGFIKRASKTDRYVFAYIPILPAVTAIVFSIILLSFSIEVAVRAIKLALLRLIAPVPILSYMDPKGGKDGAFSSWVKALTSTYLDLFVRLALVYFVIYLIQDLIVNGLVINTGSGVVGVLSFILICIGLFVFAKQAPKFLKEALGMKGDAGTGLLSGLGAAVGAAGAIPSGIASARASRAADEAYDRAHGTNTANNLVNRGKHIIAGIAGGALGAGAGIGAAASAKDHQFKAAVDAVNKRNAKVLSAGRDGGTFFGGVGASVRQFATGESAAQALEARWKADEERLKYREQVNSERKTIMDRASSKGIESTDTRGTVTKTAGPLAKYRGMTFNAAQFSSDLAAAKASGGYKKYVDSAGHVISQSQYAALTTTDQARYTVEGTYFQSQGHEVSLSDGEMLQREVNDLNIADYAQQALAGTIDDSDIVDANARYRESTGHDVETTFGGDTGLKARFGEESRAIRAEKQRIADEKQGFETQRDIANSKRFGGS